MIKVITVRVIYNRFIVTFIGDVIGGELVSFIDKKMI